MPNWCECDLTVTGKNTGEFEEYAKSKEEVLDTEKFIPYDGWSREVDELAHMYYEVYHQSITDGFNLGGDDWCCKSWGTKWGICRPKILKHKPLKYTFECAWSPCIPVVLKMSKIFPNLKFTMRYYECGMSFQGVFIAKGGIVIRNDTRKYNGTRGG